MFIVKSIEETLNIIKSNFNDYALKTKIIKIDDALHYVSKNDIYSKENVPHFNRSIVDGYAVDYNSVKLASNSTPAILKLVGEVEMGMEAKYEVSPNTTVYVPTGGHLPTGANAVVMIENTDQLNDQIFINKGVSMNENTFHKGTDIAKDELVLKKNTFITPLVIGTLKSLGIREIEVYQRLSVSIISTGDEIVGDVESLNIGEIRDINTYTIKNKLITNHFVINEVSIIKDDFIAYQDAVKKGFLTSDIVISSGGSSVGEKDYTFDILQNMGANVLVHGVNIKPGKPTVIAKYQHKLFLGLPGQPTSAYVVLNTLLKTIYNTIYQIDKPIINTYVEATLDTNIHSVSGRQLYQIVKLSMNQENKIVATPLFAKSGMIKALQQADGYIIISDLTEGVTAQSIVKVYGFGD
ncbi:MAG: molybdopterin molybdotransferase MoeA [Firmicutes bacterium]|nr:molybdopterin molybdotransferase MoeA [Bacillota bacterium]